MDGEEPQEQPETSAPWQQLGEFGLIERLNEILPVAGARVLQAGGDDAAVVAAGDGQVLLLTTDMMVEDRHFRRTYPPQAVGHRLLAANLSDIAAMGGRPAHVLITLALPRDLAPDYVDLLAKGLAGLARNHGVAVVGGDTGTSPGPLFLSATATGYARAGQVKYRRSAQPDDRIFVTGTLGRSALGLAALAAPTAGDTQDEGVKQLLAEARQHHLYPEPQVKAGTLLGEMRRVGALIDISDGLSSELHHLAQASSVTMAVSASRLPLPPDHAAAARSLGLDPLAAAVHGGEEFQLLGTVRPDGSQSLLAQLSAAGIAATLIGSVRRGPAQVLLRNDKGVEEPLQAGGWRHF